MLTLNKDKFPETDNWLGKALLQNIIIKFVFGYCEQEEPFLQNLSTCIYKSEFFLKTSLTRHL